MKLSVVILNFNVSNFLFLCLQSVEAALKEIDGEIIVVDNNSEDNSCEMVTQAYPEVILIKNDSNEGFARGNNIGVSRARGEYICILNPDTVVAEDAFKNLLQKADTLDNLGAMSCQLVDGRGLFLPESKRCIPKPVVALKKLLGNNSSYYDHSLDRDEHGETEILVGAFMLMKRAVYKAMGGFDEAYFMYGEDIDLSYSLLKAGYRNYYLGSTRVVHYKGESTLKDHNYVKRFYGAMKIFYRKHFKTHRFINGLVVLAIDLAFILHKNVKPTGIRFRKILYLSGRKRIKVKGMNRPVSTIGELRNVSPETMIIFDADYISFRKIIQSMIDYSHLDQCYFRIQPKGVNFIIGSDSNLSRGDAIEIQAYD